MSGTRCPRCGRNIEPEDRFCPGCAFPVREADQVSDQLISKPVPFRLSDEHRRIYAASAVNNTPEEPGKNTLGNRAGKPAGGAKKHFILPGLIVALVLLAAFIFVWKNGKNKNAQVMPVLQPESSQSTENTKLLRSFAAETETEETEWTGSTETIEETRNLELNTTEAEEVSEDTEEVREETEAVIEEESPINETEETVTEKKEPEEKLTEQRFLVTVKNGTGGGYYHSGEKVLITAAVPANSGLEFSGWEINEGDILLSGRMMEAAYFIMPKEDVTVTAGLSEIRYTVTVTNGEGGGEYSAGDKVTLTANEPEKNYEFDSWNIISGDMILSNSVSETVFFYMPREDVEISAVYREKTYALTIENGTAEATELHAGEATLITADEADDGYVFAGWTIKGDATVEDSQKEQTTLTIGSGDVEISAVYKEKIYKLTVENGTAGATELCAGETTTITADEAENEYIFTGWTIEGDASVEDSQKEQTTLTIGSGDVEISAVYRKKTYILTVKNGTAGATELSSGKTTVITANKAEIGHIFTGWTIEGDAFVEDPQKEQTTLTIGSGDVSVTAKYDVIPVLLRGHKLNEIFLELADSETNGIKQEYDKKIKRFCRSGTAPSKETKTKDISTTGRDVLAWYDDTDGTIFWYTDIKSVRLNENASGMFYCLGALREIDFAGIDTVNATDMSSMFSNCSSLTNLDLSGFDTRNVTSMWWMFGNCSNLSSLDLSSFNTGSVTSMEAMFENCSSLKSVNLSSFDVRSVTDMSMMFKGCSKLISLDLSSFDTESVTDMRFVFDGCSNLTSLDLSNFDTGMVTEMNGMFVGCSSLTSLNLKRFDTRNVSDMSFMFKECSSLTSLDLSSFKTENVTDMGSMFWDCNRLTSLDLSNFDTGNVTYMSDMFWKCSNLTNLDLSNFDTGNVEYMSSMFNYCSRLKEPKTSDEKIKDEYLRSEYSRR